MAPRHAHRADLDNPVMRDVEAGRLGVENDDNHPASGV